MCEIREFVSCCMLLHISRNMQHLYKSNSSLPAGVTSLCKKNVPDSRMWKNTTLRLWNWIDSWGLNRIFVPNLQKILSVKKPEDMAQNHSLVSTVLITYFPILEPKWDAFWDGKSKEIYRSVDILPSIYRYVWYREKYIDIFDISEEIYRYIIF